MNLAHNQIESARTVVLNPVKISPKSSWGGKRAGAGRKKDPNSQRARCEQYEVSPYSIRQGVKLLEFDEAFGTTLSNRVLEGEIKPFQAHRIAALVIVRWRSEGEPEDYDASWADKAEV